MTHLKLLFGSLFSLNIVFIDVDNALVTMSLMVKFTVFERHLSSLKSIVLEDAIFNKPERFPLFLVIKF
jgi:hypothetical protein